MHFCYQQLSKDACVCTSNLFYWYLDAFAETKKEVVDLHHETTPKVMAAILDYVYSGKLKMNVEYFTLFLRNADYFGLEGLKNELPKALSTRLNANNCISTLVLAGMCALAK